jgi:glutamine synthetase
LEDRWDADWSDAAAAVEDQVRSLGLRNVRVSFADQHGLLHGKVLDAAQVPHALRSGVSFPGSLLTKDTGRRYAFRVWEPDGGPTLASVTGARDMLMVPDPATFRVLPWLDRTGWMLCDLYSVEGAPVALSTRRICAEAHQKLTERGLRLRAGLEMEFHLFRVDEASGDHQRVHPGWDLLSELYSDQIEPLLEPIQRSLAALGLPPRTIEAEHGPSQVELTFAPADGIELADHAVLLRAAVKQVARRHGLHATFMSRPAGDDTFTTGWHLHQSVLSAADGRNLFAPTAPGDMLSETAMHYLGGLLAHAPESCLLTTPTITGYKRYQPYSIAPDRVVWSRQHRGAMLRVIDEPPGPATRIENRAGDPAANPYLYLASQILSGVDGIDAKRDAPPPSETPYEAEAGPLLPRTLGDAIDAFDRSDFYRSTLGDEIVDYLVTLKRSEWTRFGAAVTDWEQREYYETF